jgi:hypothetical protein
MRVSAVIVTKGDRYDSDSQTYVNVNEIKKTLSGFDEVIVWDNSKACKDVRVFGRYAGAMLARNEIIYVQDDDCVTSPRAVVGSFLPGRLVCNVPPDRRREYAGTGVTLMGWGSVFGKSKIAAFRRYLDAYPQDELFERECDRVFSYLHHGSVMLVDVPMMHLDAAHGMDRMGREPRHGADLREVMQRMLNIHAIQFAERRSAGVEVI